MLYTDSIAGWTAEKDTDRCFEIGALCHALVLSVVQ